MRDRIKKNMSDAKNCLSMGDSKNPNQIFDRLLFHFKMAATLFTAIVLLSGCGRSLLGLLKPDGKSQSSNPQSTLIKPKLDDAPALPDSQPKVLDDLEKKPEEPQPVQERNPESARPEKESGKILPDDPPQAPAKEIAKPPKRLTGTEQGQFPEEKDQKRGDKPAQPVRDTKGSEDDEMLGTETEERSPSFKKHDHSKYLTTIKNSAIDVVNKEPDSVYARMCRHNTSEEWSLYLYFTQGKNYHFRIYVWDPIENMWTETFESEKRPVTGYKKHLSFSSAGKKCISLKGSDRE